MADQSRSKVIKDNPIGYSLDALRNSFSSICEGKSIPWSLDGLNQLGQEDLQTLTLDLLSTLQSLRTPRLLRSASSGKNLLGDLSRLIFAVNSDDFYLDRVKPLLNAVLIQRASDSEIWSAVFDLTTFTRQGVEQTRDVVEKKVFEEIRLCTYRDVEGFFEKYFEGKDWTRRALDTYEEMKDHHVDGEWTDIPDPPVQAEVLDWWFRFQEVFCSEERRRYYSTTRPKDLVGAEAQRQIDLFVKRKHGQPPDAAHDWRDVDVIGELKASNNNKKATLLQLGRYVRDVFSCQPTRRPGAFDIHKKPERFIQVIAGYTMMNDEELGLDIFTDRDGDGRLIYIEQDGASGRKRLRLDSQPFTHQRAIVCRGTCCYLTKPSDAEDWSCVSKLSWTSDRRKPEEDLLRLAHQRGVEGIANQGQNEVTYDVEDVQGTSLLAPTNGPYDNRVFRCLVISPAGRAIHKHKKKSELLGALRDAIKAHRSLYLKGNILHRDISENNIIITDSKTTGHMGMLIDLDLARELGSGRSGARCRTGTMEFMAIECARRGWGSEWPKDALITKWYTGSYREIAHAKRGDMGVDGFEDILEEFPPHFDCFKSLCREMRGILFPYRGGLFVGTPKDPEILYEPIIKAFGKAIDDIMAMEG
ncbi:hypothetical protein HRG_011264 [Hirsutella rhossiliensis]